MESSPPLEPVVDPSGPDDHDPVPAPVAAPGHRWASLGWIGLAVAIVAVAAVAYVLASRSGGSSGSSDALVTATPSHLVGHRLPNLSYTTLTGHQTSLGALAGRAAVVNFWSATCVPCRTEMPALERIHRTDGAKVTFVGVDAGDGVGTARDAARQFGATYDLALDPDRQIVGALGVVALPTTVVVGADGIVTHVHVGAIDPAQLERWISQAQP